MSSVAVGVGAQATGTNITAIGDNANAAGNFAVALGNNASATHTNSVALGNASVTASANSVSVGSVGGERRIQNVAPGVLGTDAVNMDQLNALGAGTSAAIDAVEKLASRGTAIAMASMQSMPNLAAGESGVGIGVGHFNGETAVGASYGYAITNKALVSLGVSNSGGKTGARAGIGFKF